MAKIVTGKLNERKGGKAASVQLSAKRVRNADGRTQTLYTVDLASPGFERQFSTVFQRAVNKARRENKKVTGSPDVEPARG